MVKEGLWGEIMTPTILSKLEMYDLTNADKTYIKAFYLFLINCGTSEEDIAIAIDDVCKKTFKERDYGENV